MLAKRKQTWWSLKHLKMKLAIPNEGNSECTTLKKMGLEDKASFWGSRPIFRCELLDSKVGRFMMYLHCRKDAMIFLHCYVWNTSTPHLAIHHQTTPPLRETCSKGSLRHDFASLRMFSTEELLKTWKSLTSTSDIWSLWTTKKIRWSFLMWIIKLVNVSFGFKFNHSRCSQTFVVV